MSRPNDPQGRRQSIAACLCGFLLIAFPLGCRPTETEIVAPSAESASSLPSGDLEGDDGNDHSGHDHAELGPHGGHIVVLEPGHHHAEWVHIEEENIVEVYLEDDLKDATGVQLVAEVQGKEPAVYDLEPAEEVLGSGGYQISSPNLLTNIQMSDGEAIRVTLVVESSEGTLKAAISDDHGHDH